MTDFRKLFKKEDFVRLHSNTMKDGYKSKDAGDMWEPSSSPEDFSDMAQSILNEALDKATVVYACKADLENSYLWSHHQTLEYDIHKALLIQVENIKECEHENAIHYHKEYFKCGDCHKELIPTGFKVK